MDRYIGKEIARGVYQTTQYDKFKFGNNRSIDRRNVESIKESILKIGLSTPIEVTDDYFIKNGQHRFIALKELGLPITYRFSLSNTFSLEEIAEENSIGKKWTTLNHIETRANAGNENYIRVNRLINKYPDVIWADIALALRKNNGIKAVKEGRLQVTEEEYLRADELLTQAKNIYSLLNKSKYASRKYFSAFINILKAGICSYGSLYEAMDKRKQYLWKDEAKPADRDDAVRRIDKAYNHYLPKNRNVHIAYEYDRIFK